MPVMSVDMEVSMAGDSASCHCILQAVLWMQESEGRRKAASRGDSGRNARLRAKRPTLEYIIGFGRGRVYSPIGKDMKPSRELELTRGSSKQRSEGRWGAMAGGALLHPAQATGRIGNR